MFAILAFVGMLGVFTFSGALPVQGQTYDAGDSDTDRAALVALYNATGGANWGNNGNWLSNAPMGEWHGVTTDSDGRVTHLDLRTNQLTGEIPAELGNLTNLEGLDLYGNQLTGEIPAELGNLTNLTHLYLSGNQLTGEIPAELGNLANLQTLHLYSNQLTGAIPAELGSLPSLQSLWLQGNQLTGAIPAELGSLPSLEVLDLRTNQLTGEIPAELGDLTNLEGLWLASNQLTGEIPAELGNLTNLKYLYLSGNQLTGEIPAELGNLTNLELLSLNRNQLTGAIPAELGNLTNLRWLRLYDNQLTGAIPAELGDLTNLTELQLRSNQLTGCIPEGLRNIRRNDFGQLGLPFCMPSASAGDAASDRAALVAIYNATGGANWGNNRNWLSNAPMGEWHGVTTDSDGRVTHLDLRSNQLTGEIPAELGSLSNLTNLNLSRNQLTGSIPAELGSLTNLTRLGLSLNQLTGEIPAELGSLSNLTNLNLSQNQLTGEIPAELGSLAGLEGLFLRGNGLTGCIPNGLRGIGINDLSQLGLPFCDMPGAPSIATPIVPGDASLTVAWAAPINTGSSAITAYDLRYIETGAADKSDANWTVVEDVWAAGSGSLQYTLSGLTGGTQYEVQVRAVNAAGASAWSSSAIGTPATWGAIRSFSPPSAALGGEVVVTVTASGYGPFGGIMETLPAGFSYVSSSLPSVTVNGQEVTFSLLGETDFTYTVAAPSAEGSYSFSGVLTNSDRAEVPVGGAITIAVTAGDPLIARYDANGNSMIERGEVIAAINDYLFGEGDGVISRSDVIRLTNLYLFAPSTPHNRPGAPTGLTAAGNGQTRIDLSWRAPASDGGAAITGYRIEVSENGSTWNDLVANTRNPATSYSHTGLTAGSTRHYRVSAINSAGTGPASKIAAGDAATDRAALVTLYNATDGANWANNDNWLSNAPMGEWHGVTTDSDGRVTRLDLPYNQLTGGIPAELGNLSNLVRLALSGNRLTGGIPAELGNLAYLKYLDLSFNQLTGEIPAELGNLSNLTQLFLHNNQLTGEIPAELGNLTNLEYLDLSNNQLTGEIPEELGGLANLTQLFLHTNQLTGEIPAGLGSLTNLVRLALSGNRLTGGIPAELGSLAGLEQLFLGENGLTGGIPAELGSLNNLEVLYLDSNQLTGGIPPELADLSNLASLYLSGNQLTGCIPEGLQGVANNDFASLGLPFCGAGNPDLIVQSPSASDNNPDMGGPLILYATVKNVGDGRLESARLTYYLSDNDTISGTDSAIRTVDVLDIDASRSIQMVLYGQNAPQDGGTYHYGACVHSAVPSESNTRNNCSDAYPVVVDEPGNPDLIVQSPSASDNNPDMGGPLILYATVKNVGDGRLESARLTYYLSDNDTISGTDSAIRTVDVLDIDASRSIQMVLYGQNAPQDGGTYHYGACVHSAVPSESNTRNNCSDAYPVVVDEPGNPDLIVQSPSASDNNPDMGGPLILYATVKNVGDGRLESARLTYYLSDNDTISGTDSAIRTVDVLDIDASRSIQMVLYGQNAPQDGGTYYYGACVHSAVPSESNTRNNCSDAYPVVVDEPGNPDLIVQSPSASDNNPDMGGPLILYATVKNVGDGRLESARLTYYLSDNDTISGTDSAIRTVDVLDIDASRSIQMVLYGQNAPQDGGTYYYGACVHSAVPSESNTRNNCSDAYPVVVDEPGKPYLFAFVTAAGDAAVMYADEPSVTIFALVGNEGDGTSSSTPLRFYLSSDSSITPTDDTLVGEIIVRAIETGSSRDYSISMTAPSSEGTYYYYVCVDSVPGESDMQDNCQENAYSVFVLTPVWSSYFECGRKFSLSFTPPFVGYNYWFEGTIRARTSLSSVTVRTYVDFWPFEERGYIDDGGGILGSMSANQSKDYSVTEYYDIHTYTGYSGCDFYLAWEY